ncbi:hypothetical protein LTS18_000487, partial [Coniosporium uncinatum]
ISIAWASNWQYTGDVPTATEGWRSIMSAPRRNYLANITDRLPYQLISEPYDILPIVEREMTFNDSIGNSSAFADYSSVESGALYFEANISSTISTTIAGSFTFTISSSVSGESIRGGTSVGGDTWLDRSNTDGFQNRFFTDKFSATGIYDNNGTWAISGIVDRTVLELFVQGGEQSATMLFFPTSPLDTISISARDVHPNATASVGIWALRSGWAAQENANGTVEGNVTSMASMVRRSGHMTLL